MKVSFVSNIDKKIAQPKDISEQRRLSNAKKIASKKIDNTYSSFTNRANTVILFKFNCIIFQSFANKSNTRNEGDRSFSNNRTQILKSKEKCKKLLLN